LPTAVVGALPAKHDLQPAFLRRDLRRRRDRGTGQRACTRWRGARSRAWDVQVEAGVRPRFTTSTAHASPQVSVQISWRGADR
jgi:hypothetical protein